VIDEIVAIFGIQPQKSIDKDVELIAKKHKILESSRRLISSLIASKGGRPVGQVDGHEIAVLPASQAEVLTEIHQRIPDEIGIQVTIGVGEDARQAMAALRYAQENAPNSIKIYETDMENAPERDVKEQSVAVAEDDIMKSEKYVSISQDEKTKVAQVLQSVQQNKQIFDALKQENPEAYSSVVAVVQSLTEMLTKDKKDQEVHVAKMIEKINRHMHNHGKKNDEKHAKDIQKEIDRLSASRLKEEKEKRAVLYDNYKSKYHRERKASEAFAKKTGHHNPKFLQRLLSAFKG